MEQGQATCDAEKGTAARQALSAHDLSGKQSDERCYSQTCQNYQRKGEVQPVSHARKTMKQIHHLSTPVKSLQNRNARVYRQRSRERSGVVRGLLIRKQGKAPINKPFFTPA